MDDHAAGIAPDAEGWWRAWRGDGTSGRFPSRDEALRWSGLEDDQREHRPDVGIATVDPDEASAVSAIGRPPVSAGDHQEGDGA